MGRKYTLLGVESSKFRVKNATLTHLYLDPFCSELDRERMNPADQPSSVARTLIERAKLLLTDVTVVYGHV
jgi:hypothetical protein